MKWTKSAKQAYKPASHTHKHTESRAYSYVDVMTATNAQSIFYTAKLSILKADIVNIPLYYFMNITDHFFSHILYF